MTSTSSGAQASSAGDQADPEQVVIAGRYRLKRLIGRGGMGAVWLAEHLTLRTDVALKLIDSELGRLAQPRARFAREAQLAARVKSSHAVQVFDHGVDDGGQPYIVMEYLEGESLRERLDRGPLTLAETARVVSHVCRALSRAHEAGLIHRDIKPENLFVAREGDEDRMKILDFGVAKAADALSDPTVDPTRTGAMLGTPFYMSPEQAQGLKTIDLRTDLWSMGVVVCECLTGERQFAADALGPLIAKIMGAPIVVPSAAAPNVRIPKEVDSFVVHALQRDPAARFASAKDFAEAFLVASGMSASVDTDARGGSAPPASLDRPLVPPPIAAVEFATTMLAEEPPKASNLARTESVLPGSSSKGSPLSPMTPVAPRPPWALVALMGVIILVLSILLFLKR